VRGALHAEWTKLRTLAGTGWLLVGTVAATAGVSVFAVESTSCRDGFGCPGDPAKLSLTGVQFGQPAAQPVGGPGRAGGLGRRGAAGRRAGVAAARRVNDPAWAGR
jgi:ABC-2 type transport system permease protein